MGESAEDLEFKMAKAEKALSSVGVTIRGETADELLSIEEILGRVAGAWDQLSDSQKQAVAEAMAGTNRSSAFQAIMGQYDSIKELTDDAMQANGELMEANKKRVESLDGTMNQLRTTVEKMYSSFINSEGVINSIKAIDGALQWMMEHGETTVAMVVALAGAWAGIKFGSIVDGLGGIIEQIILMGTESAVATGAINALKGGLIALGGAAVIAGIVLICKKLQEIVPNADRARESLVELGNVYKGYQDTKKQVTDLKNDSEAYFEAQEALQGLTEGTEEYQKMLEISDEKLAALGQNYPDIQGILENENISLENKRLKIEQIIEALERENRQNMINGLATDNDLKALQERIDSNIQLLNQYEKAVAEYKNGGAEVVTIGNSEFNLADEATAEFFENIRKDIAYCVGDVENFNDTLKGLQKDGLALDRQVVEMGKEAVDIKNQEVEAQNALTQAKQETANVDEGNGTDIDSTERAAELEAERVAHAKELNEQYVNSLNKLQEASDLITKIQDGLSIEDMNTILNSDLMEGFKGSINDADAMVEHLKGKMGEMQDAAYEAYGNMMLADQDFWNDAVTQCARALGVNEQEFINYINSKGLARNVDVTNAQNATDAENQMNASLCKQLLQGYAGVVNSKAGNRKTDMSNVANFLNTQEAKEAQTIDELKKAWAAYYNAKVKAVQREYLDLKYSIKDMDAGQVDPAVYKQLQDLNNSIQNWYKTNKDVTNYFESISTSFGGVSGALNQAAAAAGAAIGSATSGSGGSSSKPASSGGSGGSSTSTKKEVADMESLVDRYYQLNDAIKNVTKSLEKNRQAQANVKTKKEYKKLINEEISLINKEITAMQNLQIEQQKERDELKQTLKQNGFAFDNNNNITNYAKRLQEMTNYANSLSDPDQKEAAIAHVKAINDIIEKYTKLEDNTIPETSQAIEDLKNDIIDINKEMQENLKLIDQLGDRYFDVLNNLADIDNKLSMNDLQQSNENGLKKIQLMKEEILLLGKKQELLKQQQQQSQKEANDLKSQLEKQGLKFDANGNITNYEAFTKQLTDNINNLYGDSKDEAQEAANDLLDLIDRYMTLTDDTIPDLIQQQQEYAYEMEDINEEMKNMVVDIQKQITQAYENELNKRYSKLQENLKKEQDALNKAYEEESYQKGLNEQQRALDEIAQQIAIYSRDTSEAGKARLEQLKREYEQQQQAINDSIRENEKTLSDERFEEEGDKLDNELADLLAPEKLIATVNDAITSGMITVGDEVIKLDDLMTNWIDETGDGMYALGGVIKDELLANLQGAKTLMQEMGLTDMGDLTTKLESMNAAGNTGKQSTVNFNDSLVKIESMSNDVDVNNLADTIKREVYQAVNDAMK